MKRKLHVIFLPRWYPHRYDPMMGLFIRRHGLAVSTHADVSVLYVHPDDRLQHPVYEIITEDNHLLEVQVYFRKSRLKPSFLGQLVNLFRFFIAHWKGYHAIRKLRRRPDLIHVHVLTRCGVVALINKWLTGTPYVITEHWTRYLPGTGDFEGTIRKFLTRLVVKHAAAVMPVTANLRDAMKAHGLTNPHYVIIPNVVDTRLFKPLEIEKKSGKKILVHLSCFTDRQKNISGILRVVHRLSQHRDDFMLRLIGDGEDFVSLKALSDQLRLTGTFTEFTGLREGEELARLLAEADLMIMFSHYENLPVVILESFACGVPVISTDVGGIREHLHEDLGRLIPAGDEEELYRQISNFLDKPDQYDPVKLRQYAVDHFSNEVIGASIYDVYCQSLARKDGKSADETEIQ